MLNVTNSDIENRTLHLSMVPFSMISYLSESLCSVLTECLGIDELHSHELSRRNSSYLCILVDNERRTVWDVLDSRSKMALSLFFSNIPREERLRVKYVTIDMWEPYKDVARTYFHNYVLIWRYLEELVIFSASEKELPIRFLKMFNIP